MNEAVRQIIRESANAFITETLQPLCWELILIFKRARSFL